MMQRKKVLFTDGEGPLVFKDLAQDLMGRIIGPDFFAVLSLYDDYLAEVKTEGYQAGDTLALVVPHFLAHGLTDEDVYEEARETQVCLGVEEYIEGLKRDGWEVRVISTAYSPMWELIGEHLGIPQEHIACTELNLEKLRKKYQTPEFDRAVQEMEQAVLPLLPLVAEAQAEIDEGKSVIEVFKDGTKFAPLREILDEFYWDKLKDLGYQVLEAVEVIGGRRKIEVAQRFARELEVSLGSIPFVNDSITDDALNAKIKKEGGLPLTVNGNFYALRNSRAGVATKDMRALRPVLDAWYQNGIEGVESFIETQQESRLVAGKERAPIPEGEEGPFYFMIEGASEEGFQEALGVHKRFRGLVRGAAAKLG